MDHSLYHVFLYSPLLCIYDQLDDKSMAASMILNTNDSATKLYVLHDNNYIINQLKMLRLAIEENLDFKVFYDVTDDIDYKDQYCMLQAARNGRLDVILFLNITFDKVREAAKYGHLNIIEYFLPDDREELKEIISILVDNNHIDIVYRILSTYPDLKLYPTDYLKLGRINEMFNSDNLYVYVKYLCFDLVVDAAREGNRYFLEQLGDFIEDNDLEVEDEYWSVVLSAAANQGNKKIIELAINYGGQLLHYKVNCNVIKFLVEKDFTDQILLYSAAYDGNRQLVNALLDRGFVEDLQFYKDCIVGDLYDYISTKLYDNTLVFLQVAILNDKRFIIDKLLNFHPNKAIEYVMSDLNYDLFYYIVDRIENNVRQDEITDIEKSEFQYELMVRSNYHN